MKEQIRVWNHKGDLNVKYRDGSGAVQVWSINQDNLLEHITGIIETYESQRIVLTNRQLYYQLVAGGLIPNAQEIYKRICTFLTDCRYNGDINWESIEDRGRTPERHSEWNSIRGLVDSALYSYRLPRWNNQDYYVELYCEKEAMESVLKPIADKYHIYFGCNKGYSSASTMYNLARRMKEQYDNNKKLVILYLGDHDPSGLDMIRDIKERITEFIWYNEKLDYEDSFVGYDIVYKQREEEGIFQVIPVALTTEQVEEYNPPPNPAKITDPRARNYIEANGESSWELDALKPEILIKLTENAISDFIDIDKYKAVIRQEEKDKKNLLAFAKKITKENK